MNFQADENIDIEIIDHLRKAGYNIFSISEEFPGVPDEDVIKITNKHNAVLLTADKDFGELVFRKGEVIKGVVLVRIFGVPQQEKAQIIFDAFNTHAGDFADRFTVISKKKIRIKRMPMG